jgi:hypothetical protein
VLHHTSVGLDGIAGIMLHHTIAVGIDKVHIMHLLSIIICQTVPNRAKPNLSPTGFLLQQWNT